MARNQQTRIGLKDIERFEWNPYIKHQFIVRGDVMLTDIDIIEEPGKPAYKYVDAHVYFVDSQLVTLLGKTHYTQKDIMAAIQISPFLKKYYAFVGDIDPDIRIWPVKPLPPERDELDQPVKK